VKPTKHLTLLASGIVAWVAFWVAGLPSYYQQYSAMALGVACTLLSVAISLLALFVLSRGRPGTRVTRSVWISCYFTVPFAILDTLYCGLHLGRGPAYLHEYWYLTVFYVTPWLTFVPTALLLGSTDRRNSDR
jgi:hypothetical protein